MAREPGLAGRIWSGQGLVFDEGYGILMLLGILTDRHRRYSADPVHLSHHTSLVYSTDVATVFACRLVIMRDACRHAGLFRVYIYIHSIVVSPPAG